MLTAPWLAGVVRGHGGIENGLHWVRDETSGEDVRRVRKGQAPQVLAARRNAAVTVLNWAGVTDQAAAWRRSAAHPQEALDLGQKSEN